MALDSEILLNPPETDRQTEVAVEPALRGSVLVEPIGPLVLDSGERLEGQIKY
jgi:hypothetical protein